MSQRTDRMGQAPVTGPRKLQEIRGLRGGWWRKEAQSTQLWLKSFLKRQIPRASGDRGASRVRGGSRAKGEVQITNGLGTLFASCGAVAWKEDFNLIRRLTTTRLTHHCFVLSTALELAADDGSGSALVREKSKLFLWCFEREPPHPPAHVHNKLRGSPQDFQSVGLSRCHNNEIEIQGPIITMKSTEMRHSRMWLALQFREPEGPPPSSFQAAIVQSKLSIFFAE